VMRCYQSSGHIIVRPATRCQRTYCRYMRLSSFSDGEISTCPCHNEQGYGQMQVGVHFIRRHFFRKIFFHAFLREVDAHFGYMEDLHIEYTSYLDQFFIQVLPFFSVNYTSNYEYNVKLASYIPVHRLVSVKLSVLD